jgi:hypothetical protein
MGSRNVLQTTIGLGDGLQRYPEVQGPHGLHAVPIEAIVHLVLMPESAHGPARTHVNE